MGAGAGHTTWQWQLSGRSTVSVDAQMLRRRPVRHPASAVAGAARAGRARGLLLQRRLAASAAARTRGAFPPPSLGRPLEGWPGERWLDVRALDVLGPIIERRLDLCARKGFDGVEADNVDALRQPQRASR